MKTFNIHLRDLTFPVITNTDIHQETIEAGLDCLLPSKELIPTGVKLILVSCLNIDDATQWTLHFEITDPDPDDPDFIRDFASDLKNYILSNEEDPDLNIIINETYGTVTLIFHAG